MKAERAEWFARLSIDLAIPVPVLKAHTQRELRALIDEHQRKR